MSYICGDDEIPISITGMANLNLGKEDAGDFIFRAKEEAVAAAECTSITTLPPELHLKIFENLDPDASTCFGLTCKRFYPIHTSLYGKVRLFTTYTTDWGWHKTTCRSYSPLGELLRSWMPSDLTYAYEEPYKFLTKERIAELEPIWEASRREREWQTLSWGQQKVFLRGMWSDDEDDEQGDRVDQDQEDIQAADRKNHEEWLSEGEELVESHVISHEINQGLGQEDDQEDDHEGDFDDGHEVDSE